MSKRTQAAIRLVDWFKIFSDLKRAGINNSEVARRLGVPPTTIASWKNGVEPKYSDGARLIELHASVPVALYTEIRESVGI